MPDVCIGRTFYEGRWYPCTLPEAHTGRCRSWVEQADIDELPALNVEPNEVASGQRAPRAS